MSTRYPGGLISRSKPVIVPPVDGEGGSAPGVWTLEQASYYTKQGTWPKPFFHGGLWGSGYNFYGQLGQSDVVYRSSPVQVGSQSDWLNISASGNDVIAVKTDGTLWGWGRNNSGHLGQGNTISRSSPTQVGALTNWKTVSSGGTSCFAIKADGTLWAWGNNGSGQLGQINTISRSSPVQVGTNTDWVSVAATSASFSAVRSNGTMWSCGYNYTGELGLNLYYTTNVSSPTQVGTQTDWQSVYNGVRQIIAKKTSGALWGWGENQYGQLGTSPTNNRSSPVQIGALTTWDKVSKGVGDFSFAIKNDGTLWAFGRNDNFGQLGLGDKTTKSSPTQVGTQSTWLYAATGYASSFATKTDGTLWSWGANSSGQLGQDNRNSRSSPVQVGSETGWTKVAADSSDGYFIKK